jgi:hypothetical protein
MSNELIFTILFGLVFGLAYLGVIILWVEGIDYMNKNHPDYKGEDFFNEEEGKEKND